MAKPVVRISPEMKKRVHEYAQQKGIDDAQAVDVLLGKAFARVAAIRKFKSKSKV